jgi:chemotaxis protein MotB
MIIEEDTGGDEGENYFVSMTDMMVGVLFIFIIMLMSFALDLRKSTDAKVDSLKVIQEVADKLDILEKQVRQEVGRLDDAGQRRRDLLKEIQSQLKSEGLSVKIDEANGVLRLTEDSVRFAPSRADLVGKNKENVVKIAHALGRVLPKYARCRKGPASTCDDASGATLETFFIEGHTDSTGEDAMNWQLSTARANSTYQEIIATVPALRELLNRRMEEIISVSGYAATRPLDLENTPQAWARNRRIDLRFVMETESRKGLEHILDVSKTMRQEIERLRDASGLTK